MEMERGERAHEREVLGSWGRSEEKWEAEADRDCPGCWIQPMSPHLIKNGTSTILWYALGHGP